MKMKKRNIIVKAVLDIIPIGTINHDSRRCH